MFGSISGSVIHGNDLHIVELRLPSQRPNAFDRFANGIFFIVTRNDYRSLHGLYFCAVNLIHDFRRIGGSLATFLFFAIVQARYELHDQSS